MEERMLTKTSREVFVSPRITTAVSLLPENAWLVASGPNVDSSYIIEGQEVDNYFEEGALSDDWD